MTRAREVHATDDRDGVTMAEAETPTQFAWRVLGMGDYPPPEPKRGPRYADAPTCWLCGGPTGGRGWPLRKAIASTFASQDQAAAPSSDAACQACAALAVGETWKRYVRERGPDGIKLWPQASWRSYPHLFQAQAPVHRCPRPTEWRDVLLDPPTPPFLAIIATSGQKNLIFRGAVAYSRAAFPVILEELRIWVDRDRLAGCLGDFEAAYAAGLSKDSILSGQYHPGATARLGVRRFREIDLTLRGWREGAPDLMRLAHFIAQKPAENESQTCNTDSKQTTSTQPSLL